MTTEDETLKKKSSSSKDKKDRKDKEEKKKKKSKSKSKDGEEKKSSKSKKDKKSSKDEKKSSSSSKDKKDKKKKSSSSSKKDKKVAPDESMSTLPTLDVSESERQFDNSLMLDSTSMLGEIRQRTEEEEDEEARLLLSGMIFDDDDDDSSTSSGSSSSSDSTVSYREVELPNNAFDNVVLAAPDLEEAVVEFYEKTGIYPEFTGAIRGLGVRSARVAFENENAAFLEIIAPDPESSGPIGTLLRNSGLTGLVPFHWGIRTEDAEEMMPSVQKIGYTPDCICHAGARRDMKPKNADYLYMYGHRLQGMCPFFVNYFNTGYPSDHPCQYAPIVGDLLGVKITAPASDKIHQLMAHTGSTGFTLQQGPKPHFEIRFDSPEGEVCFESDRMVGFRFPGFEDEFGPIVGEAEDWEELQLPVPQLQPVTD